MDMTLIAQNCFGNDGYAAAIVLGSLVGLAAGLHRPVRSWLRISHAAAVWKNPGAR
jgi:hypothetical protein